VNISTEEKLHRLWGTMADAHLIYSANTNSALQVEVGLAYGILRQCTHVYRRGYPAPMSVGFHNTGYTLTVNLDFVDAVTDYKDFWTVAVHEALHILKGDLSRMVKLRRTFSKDVEAYNALSMISADLDVNSVLIGILPTKFPSKSLVVSVGGEPVVPDAYSVHPNLAYEKYFHQLASELTEEDIRNLTRNYRMMTGSASGGGGPDGETEDGGEEGTSPKGEGTSPGPGEEGGGQAVGSGSDDKRSKSYNKADKIWHQSAKDFEDLPPKDKDVIADILDQKRNEVVINAIESTKGSRQRGTMPSHYKVFLDYINSDTGTKWDELLARIVTGTLTATSKKVYSRPKRSRYFYTFDDDNTSTHDDVIQEIHTRFPGVKANKDFSILVAVDTSGSMDTKSLRAALNAVGSIRKSVSTDITIIQCDTSISDVYKLTNDDTVEKYIKKVSLTSRGGTDFLSPIQMAKHTFTKRTEDLPKMSEENKRKAIEIVKADILIYITDGYAPLPARSDSPPCQVLWLLTKLGKSPELMEEQINFGLVMAMGVNGRVGGT